MLAKMSNLYLLTRRTPKKVKIPKTDHYERKLHMKFSSISLYASLLCAALLPCSVSAKNTSRIETVPGIYELASALDLDFLIDVRTCTQTDESTENTGSTLQLFTAQDVNQQRFYIDQLSTGKYRISSLNSGWYLSSASQDSLSGDHTDSGTSELTPVLVDFDTAKDQDTVTALNWAIQDAGNGYVYLSCNHQYLTADDDRAYLGGSLSLQSFTGDANQKWLLRRSRISSQANADTDFYNPYEEGGKYAGLRLSMWFGTKKETLTADTLASWISDEDHRISLNSDACLTYVKTLAEKYDTQGHPRQFTTTEGSTITLSRGDFGWKLDEEKTAQLLLEEAQSSSSSRFITPIWSHKGISFEAGNDIGNTYVEIDLTNQKVWLYKDGKKLLATECVTGTYGTDRQTPGGVYSIYYRQSPAVLRGPDYTSPVEYWMAFNGGIGLHDANWRSTFGGDIYKTNGSHGCVNLPTEAAKKIYTETYIGYPVVCYN